MQSNPSCNEVKLPQSQRNRSEFAAGRIRPIGGPDRYYVPSMVVWRVCPHARSPAADTAAATALCASIAQAALAEPGERTSRPGDAFEPERFDRVVRMWSMAS